MSGPPPRRTGRGGGAGAPSRRGRSTAARASGGHVGRVSRFEGGGLRAPRPEARTDADELLVDAVELSVAAEAGVERRLLQAVGPTPAAQRVPEAIDALPVPVIDEREAHLALEGARQVPRAHPELDGEIFAAPRGVLVDRLAD